LTKHRGFYATHNTAEIRTWLGKHPRFHVHFTPTGSSWMNQVERWFGLLTDKLIRRGVHTSVKALEDDITAWIHGYFTDCRSSDTGSELRRFIDYMSATWCRRRWVSLVGVVLGSPARPAGAFGSFAAAVFETECRS
jgi:transposase